MSEGQVVNRSTEHRLFRYAVPAWRWFLVAMVGFGLEALATAWFLDVLDSIIDAIQSRDAEARWRLPMWMVCLVIMRGVGIFVGSYLLGRISLGIVLQIRTQLFDHLLHSPRELFDHATQGHVVSRITFTVNQLREASIEALRILLEEGLLVVGLLAYLFYNNWQLTAIFVGIAPLIAGIAYIAGLRFRRLSENVQFSMAELTQSVQEMVGGVDVVRIFGGDSCERHRFGHLANRNRSQQLKIIATKHVTTQVIQMLVALALAFLVWMVLGYENLDAGDVVAYVTAAALIARPIRRLSEVMAAYQRGMAAAADIFQTLDEPAQPDSGHHQLATIRRVEVEDVSFTYRGSRERVLHGVSLHLERGRHMAVVGASGSGKSTLSLLLARFYEPDSGRILIDGVPSDQCSLATLLRQIALVGQNVTLFHDTVRGNVAYGELAWKSDAEINWALECAAAAEFVAALPDGLETVLGDHGTRLSGGQRQRLAIARAVLKDAPLLILDEATSALDPESERRVLERLGPWLKQRATLTIAHRQSSVRNADEIVVLERGRVVERGDYVGLLKRGGTFARLHANSEESAT